MNAFQAEDKFAKFLGFNMLNEGIKTHVKQKVNGIVTL